MEVESVPLSKLFQASNTAYVIPTYQRPYTWDAQYCSDLLDDILTAAKDKIDNLYLGSIILLELKNNKDIFGEKSSGMPSTLHEIVDGQQRITTFALMGIALERQRKKLEEEMDNEDEKYVAKVELVNFFQTQQGRGTPDVPVIIRQEIDKYLDGHSGFKSELAKQIYSEIEGCAETLDSDNKISDALSQISKWVELNLNSISNFTLFCTFMQDKCEVIRVEALSEDDAFRMFESLNSKSDPLTAIEVFKSKIDRNEEVDVQISRECFSRINDYVDYQNNNRDKITTMSNSLVAQSIYVFDGEMRKARFPQLKMYLDNNILANGNQLVNKYLKALGDTAYFLGKILQAPDRLTETQSFALKQLDEMKHNNADTYLAQIYANLKDIDQLGNYVLLTCGFFVLWRSAYPTNDLPSFYRSLFKKNKINSEARIDFHEQAELFKKQLWKKAMTNEYNANSLQSLKTKWLKDCEVNPSLNYRNLKAVCKTLVLIDIASQYTDNSWRWNYSSEDDLEHIKAVGTEENPINDKPGNLTLLPGSINKALQDKAWPKKRQVYGHLAMPTRVFPDCYEDGSMMSPQIKDYFETRRRDSRPYLESISSKSEWDTKEIDERTQQILSNSWDFIFSKWFSL